MAVESLRYYPIVERDLAGLLLVIPGVSVGASGNLGLDIAMNTEPHTLVGRFVCHDVHPVAAYNCLDGDS
jgi:hypothetical protein